MQEETASLGKFFTELLEWAGIATEVADNQVLVSVESKSCFLKFKDLFWGDTLQDEDKRTDQIFLFDCFGGVGHFDHSRDARLVTRPKRFLFLQGDDSRFTNA